MRNKTKKTIFYSVVITLAAQLSMNLFIADFKISIAVVCFSALLFLTEDFPLPSVTCLSAAGVYLFRILLYWFGHGRLGGAYLTYMPEMAFYICYGLLLSLYIRLCPAYKEHRNQAFPVFVVIDYTANLCELLLRMGGHAPDVQAHIGILLVALLRALMIWCILTVFAQYRILLLKQEHEERYRRLLLLISRLNGEVVWMKKNTSLIEDTMNTSYQLYQKLQNAGADGRLTALALSISRDIHEIKKEYLLIMRGISEALEQELEHDGMYLEEIIHLLKSSLLLAAKELGKDFSLSFSCQDNFCTEQHYALISVFRNLFMNALEAGADAPVRIRVDETEENGYYVFTVTDNGPGILPENIPEVFKAGFSTKINYATGEVSRGLGLNLVKDLIETQFEGSISLTSIPGQTVFTIRVPTGQFQAGGAPAQETHKNQETHNIQR